MQMCMNHGCSCFISFYNPNLNFCNLHNHNLRSYHNFSKNFSCLNCCQFARMRPLLNKIGNVYDVSSYVIKSLANQNSWENHTNLSKRGRCDWILLNVVRENIETPTPPIAYIQP